MVEAVAEAEDGPGQAFWQAIAAARALAELVAEPGASSASSAGPPGAVAKSTGSALRAKSAGAVRPSVAPWRRVPPPKAAAEAAPASPAVTERAASPLTPSPDAADAAEEPDAADAAEDAGAAPGSEAARIEAGADYVFGRRGGRYFQYIDEPPPEQPAETHGQL